MGDLFRAAVYGGAVADCADCRAASAETEGAVYAAGACTRGDDREARADPGVCGDLASGAGLFADRIFCRQRGVLPVRCSDDRAQRPARRRCGEPRTGGGHLHEVLRRTAGDLPVHLLRGRRRVDDLVLPPAPRGKERGMICKHSAAMATKSPLEKSETAANTELVVSDDVTARISASMQRKSNLLKTMRGAA